MIKTVIDPDTGENVQFYYCPDESEIKTVVNNYHDFSTCRKRKKDYLNEFSTFDIETTSLKDTGFMYMWGWCIGSDVIIGRRWEELKKLLTLMHNHFHMNSRRMCVYVHNLPFEFQFMRNLFNWDEVFAVDERKIVTGLTGNFEFRCSYKLSNMSLAKFCENSEGCVHFKKDGGKFDYKEIRYPDTELSDYQLLYQYCDVKGLHEAIESKLKEDTIATIPLTSTGYARREARKVMLSNPKNKYIITDTRLSPFLYLLMRTGRRGGDTHALAQFCDEILINVDSWDIKSSYPYVMVTKKFPMTPFIEVSAFRNDGRAYLMEVEFTNIRMKSIKHMPYIPSAKCIVKQGWGNDNGRLLYADRIRTVITDIDLEIINEVYDYDDISYIHVYSSEYGMLPKEFRAYIMECFQTKTDLEDGDPYVYAKYKNVINALFGMMLTDICQISHKYEDGKWVQQDDGVETLLDRYYNSEKSFLAYQWGLWVTAHARKRLHEPTKVNLGYLVYSDTDSWKCRQGYNKEIFEEINRRVIEEAETFDVKPYSIKNGKRVYLGVWSYEGCYEEFKTMGAKKYAYRQNGELHVTVAGLNKKKGAEYLEKVGGLEAFKDGLVFPPEYSGRTYSVYDDTKNVAYATVNGHKFLTSSGLAIHETTYELGKSIEYSKMLNLIKTYGFTNIS